MDKDILVFGSPTHMIVDNGMQFESTQFKNLRITYRMILDMSENYHPQVKSMELIVKLCHKNHVDWLCKRKHRLWDKYLARIGFAIRSAAHEGIKLIPNITTFGREIILTKVYKMAKPVAKIKKSIKKSYFGKCRRFRQG